MYTLEDCVKDAWANANASGYAKELATWSLEELALDMIACRDDITEFISDTGNDSVDVDELAARIVVILKEITGRDE